MGKNAGEMTVEECRDWLAKNAGWTIHPERSPLGGGGFAYVDRWMSQSGQTWLMPLDHPIPDTLDEAAILPEGCVLYNLRQTSIGWFCNASDANGEYLADASGTTELEARFRLRVAVEMAERSKA